MRPLMIVLVVLALGIAGVTAFLARNFVGKSAQPQAEAITAQRVLVAAREIAGGAVLVEEDLRYEQWPVASVNKRYIVHTGSGDDPKSKLIGSVAARHILSGEPLTGTAVFRQDEAGRLSAMLGPGMRAISIAVSGTTSVSGFVTPGDRVDVVALMKFKDSSDDKKKAKDELHVSEIVLADVRVLAVDQNLKTGQVSVVGKTVSLEVTLKDAEKLIVAGSAASLSLVLRSQTAGAALEDDRIVHSVKALRSVRRYSDIAPKVGYDEDDGETAPAGAGREVRVNRSGFVEIRNFPD